MKQNQFKQLGQVFLLVTTCVIGGVFFSVAQAQEDTATCSDLLVTPGFFERRTVHAKDGKLVFSKEAQAYFTEQRERFRNYFEQLADSAAESEHAIRRLLLAQMEGGNILFFGGPGGAKSVISRQSVFAPIEQPNGQYMTEAFGILFHQLQSDALLRGYIDPEKLTSGIVKPSDVNTHGSMMQFRRALGDEIDKANPQLVGAMLDLMDPEKRIAQYGPITLQSRLEFVALTSNLTPSEMIAKARESNMDENMRALLNRIAFKVWLPNTVLDSQSRIQILNRSESGNRISAQRLLSQPQSRFAALAAEDAQYSSSLPDVDFLYLGAIAMAGLQLDPTFKTFTADLFDSYNKLSSASSMNDEIQYMRQLMVGGGQAPGSPTSLQSNRDLYIYALSVVQVSLLRDLLLLPEKTLPTTTLLQHLSQGWKVDEFSGWRMHEFLLTSAPGDLTLRVAETAPESPHVPEVRASRNLEDYVRYAKTARDKSQITQIKEARDRFFSAFNDMIKQKRDSVTKAVENIEKFQSAGSPTKSISASPEAVLLRQQKGQ